MFRGITIFIFILVLFSFFGAKVSATTYLPIPMDKQLSEATAVVSGIYLGKSYKKNSAGDVFTKHRIKVIESAGLANGDIINMNNFEFLTPGGTWGNLTYYSYGSPVFQEGESIVLLIKKNSVGGDNYLSNLSLGKYTLSTELGKKYVLSSVFPNDSKIGKIDYESFNEMVFNEFGEKLKAMNQDVFVYNSRSDHKRKNGFESTQYQENVDDKRIDKGRSIASVENNGNEIMTDIMNDQNEKLGAVFSVLLLAVLGVSSVYLFNRKR